MFRAMLPRFLLVIALLFAQLGGLTHGITHTMNERGRDATLAQDKHCDLCQLYAQIGGAVGSTAIQFDSVALRSEFILIPATKTGSASLYAYTARAPPYPV